MIAEIVTRLDNEVSALKQIGGAVEFDASARAKPNATPAAFVFPLSETPVPSDLANGVVQQIKIAIGVVWAVSNVADAKGAAAQVDMQALRAAGQSALLGWAPAGAAPLERGAGNLLAFKDGVMWWQDQYLTEIYVKA